VICVGQENKMRTSQTHPLQIAEVQASDSHGLIGITFCPGKQQVAAYTGDWARDLATDLDAIAVWNAAAVVTLVEEHELASLGVAALGEGVRERHMVWHHLPIRDVGTPGEAFEDAWARVGESLRGMLRSGANVLVHCKGGLGRAGLVAARLLVELGMAPDEAVRQVRAVRPGAIETAAQLSHVRARSVIEEAMPDATQGGLADRAMGAMLGLAIGDAIGTTLEFTARDSHPRLTDMIGGGPFRLKPGEWTDDTATALALAGSLKADPLLDEADLMQRFVRWQKQGEYSCTGTCFDIGVTTRQALARFKQTGDPLAGSTDPRSAGNGSLMRLAPVAIRHWNDPATLRDVAARQSRTTHAAPEAVEACIAFAEVLADAIAGRPRSEVLRARHAAWAGAIAPIMAGSWRGKHRDAVRSSGYVAHSLEAALWCTACTGTFSDAVLLAANLGDDADTTAAITGQLAGALYGALAIPPAWTDQLAWSERLTQAAMALLMAGELEREG
jgi:ADP-ribosyl-[dinitrogen reductase] hydrolase